MSGGLCLALAGSALLLASVPAETFTLSWTHTVERTEWRERYRIAGDRLELVEARVQGSGAGMEPGEGAVFADGWWIWSPALPPLDRLVLADSAFAAAYRLCTGTGCRPITALLPKADGAQGPLALFPCAAGWNAGE